MDPRSPALDSKMVPSLIAIDSGNDWRGGNRLKPTSARLVVNAAAPVSIGGVDFHLVSEDRARFPGATFPVRFGEGGVSCGNLSTNLNTGVHLWVGEKLEFEDKILIGFLGAQISAGLSLDAGADQDAVFNPKRTCPPVAFPSAQTVAIKQRTPGTFLRGEAGSFSGGGRGGDGRIVAGSKLNLGGGSFEQLARVLKRRSVVGGLEDIRELEWVGLKVVEFPHVPGREEDQFVSGSADSPMGCALDPVGIPQRLSPVVWGLALEDGAQASALHGGGSRKPREVQNRFCHIDITTEEELFELGGTSFG